MNKLKNTICYLCGNMENTEDAENWRDSFTKDLEKINIKVLNPTRPMFHDQLSESEDMRNKFKKMRENNEFSELHDIMKNIIRRDLRAVDLSTFVIVKLEPNKATWGTTHEVIQASSQRKPIFFKSYKFDSTFCANLSHEAFHAAHMILSYRGQGNNDPDGEEVHAYFSSWIVKETLDGLKRLNKKKQIE